MNPMLFADWSPMVGIIGLVVALVLYRYIVRQSTGNGAMREIAGRIQERQMAFLRREYMVIAVFMVVVTALLSFTIGSLTAIAFVSGGPTPIMPSAATLRPITAPP